MSQETPNKPNVRTCIGDFAYKLFSDALENGDGRPTFGFNFWKNNFSVEMRTKVKMDDSEGFVRLNITPRFVLEFIAFAKMVIDGDLKRWDVSFYPRKKYGDDTEPKREAKFVFGKESDESTGKVGMYFVGIGKKNVSPVKFYFDKADNHKYLDEDGSELPKELVSRVAALSYLGAIAERMSMVSVVHYEYEEYNPQNKGGSKNYSKKASGPDASPYGSFDDDMPM